jgi:predicted transcriptional regulator YdeE
MEKLESGPLHIVGISIRTTNEHGQSLKDISALWDRFLSGRLLEQIPNRTDNSVWCVYTDYEKDHTRPYTTILGCQTTSRDKIPEGFSGWTFNKGTYSKHTAKGNILQGMVFEAWTKIWNSDLPRAFTADFEIYGDKAQNPTEAEVEILISIR